MPWTDPSAPALLDIAAAVAAAGERVAVVSLRAGKIVVFGATCGLIAAAVNVSTQILVRQDDLTLASHCGVCAVASQVDLEFARLEQRIAGAITPASVAGTEDVQLRYDRLVDRVTALDGADIREFTASHPDSKATVRRLIVAMGQLAPMVDRIDRAGVGEAALAIMAPLDFDLSRMSAEADRFGEARAAAAQADLSRLYRIFSSELIALFGFGAALLALLGWHNRQLGLARDGLRRSADDLQATSSRLALANAEITAVAGHLQARNAILDRRDRELGLQNKRFDAALNNMSMALCMVDAGDRLVIYNRPFADLFGLDFAPIPGIHFDDLVALASGPQLKDVHARQRALATGDGETATFVQDLPRVAGPSSTVPDGRRFVSVSHRPMREGGWVATYEDITERRQAEARIAYLGRHDPLTGLVNRAFLVEQLDAVLAAAARHGAAVTVHFLDIDGFKKINDRFGNEAGDAALREVGRRLSSAAGQGVVARLGGDEFALVQSGATRAAAEALAARILGVLRDPLPLAGGAVDISVSAGHATFPDDGGSADALIRNADLALASAKLAGGGALHAFVPDMDVARRARRALEEDLRRALAGREFDVFFQPLVDARAVAITGYEALVRWRHPTRGLVSPVEFIPVAEEIGLIGEIGRWVLGEACARAVCWPGHLTVAVNLSPAQFGVMDLIGTVDDALARSGLDPARLELEITESVPLGDGDGTLATLHALRARGIRIAMDDFGTGYSSLSYLRRFPFDKIKIDQSFVRELASRPDCIKIIRSIASLGQSLGMMTTAEGVETAEQFAQIQAAGCDQVQGFHFGRPEPADAMLFALAPPEADAA